ncbi:MAG: hypothetical protein KIT84_35155 [Labilithrix sp.]|nr:hypothetical protein [Labilithrix sp.]MCW5816289.1 hypothetical protein [Labilithrix sp.]
MLSSDWAQHVLGWLFFRKDGWHFPLGAIRGAAYPLGTSVGYTDSNPIVAIALKPLSSLLPLEVQYIGPWLGLCFALQGFFGARLVASVAKGHLVPLLGGLMFATAPALLQRLAHDTLCSHFLLLAAIGLHLAPGAHARARRAMVGVVLLAAGIHPYLAIMALVLGVGLFYHHHARGALSRRELLGWSAGSSIAVLVVFLLIGYFGGGVDPGAGGIGEFSASPLTLFDSMGHSRVLPALPSGKSQYEGFAYLGLGGVALVVAACVAFVRERRSGLDLSFLPRPLRWASLGLAVFAMIPWFPPGLSSILSPLRSSGRFVWTFSYVALLVAIAIVVRAFSARPAIAAAIMAVALALQIVDAQPDHVRPKFASKPSGAPYAAGWESARGDYRHLALYPMEIWRACTPWDEDLSIRYAYRAYLSGLTFNSGYFARINRAAAKRACAELTRDVESGRLDAATIYVLSRPEDVAPFRAAGATCGRLEPDTTICVASPNTDLAKLLTTHHPL